MTEEREHHHSLRDVRGEHVEDGAKTRWHVDGDILYVTHDPGQYADMECLHYRLVPVEQVWREVSA